MSETPRAKLEKKAIEAWEKSRHADMEPFNNLYNEIMPFCLRVCGVTCGRYINSSDEEASIARLALLEALERYQPERGSFLEFLARVIRTRLIDFQRREKRHKLSATNLDELAKRASNQDDVEQIIEGLARQQEIERFKQYLQEYGISFNDLLAGGPRAKKTREEANRIAGLLAADQEMSRVLVEKKVLPQKMLIERCGANRKLVDRYRKYIVAHAIISVYKLSVLADFIAPAGGGH